MRLKTTLAVATVTVFTGAASTTPSPSPTATGWPEPGRDSSGKPAAERTPRTITIPAPGTLQENRTPYTPIEETTEGGRKALSLQADVLFKTGSAELSDQAEKYLADVTAKLKAASATGEVQVVGHTDDVGEPDANMTLSKQRADSVVQALQPQLINTGITLVAQGKGETRPRVKGTTPDARQRNRRVSVLYGDAEETPAQPDGNYINVPVTEPAPNPGLRPLPGEPRPLASTQRTIQNTWTVRLDVTELRAEGRFIKVGYRTRLVNQTGTNGLKYAALFDGYVLVPEGYKAQLIDKAHGEALGPLITGKGWSVRDHYYSGDNVGYPQYGWAYFPKPSRKATRLSFYVPAFGTLDNLPLS